jgi:hypothetical protein
MRGFGARLIAAIFGIMLLSMLGMANWSLLAIQVILKAQKAPDGGSQKTNPGDTTKPSLRDTTSGSSPEADPPSTSPETQQRFRKDDETQKQLVRDRRSAADAARQKAHEADEAVRAKMREIRQSAPRLLDEWEKRGFVTVRSNLADAFLAIQSQTADLDREARGIDGRASGLQRKVVEDLEALSKLIDDSEAARREALDMESKYKKEKDIQEAVTLLHRLQGAAVFASNR